MRTRHLLAPLAALVAMAAARAWTADDAIITFRVVEQFLAGHGPVFNIGERVQVFTHPLWMLVLAAWAGLGGSLFPGAMALSVAIFAAGLVALGAGFRDRPVALLAVAVAMFFSRTLMDYATSVLEAPLSFALFAGALWALRAARRWTALALLALLPLNRLDLLPWLLPFAWIAASSRWKDRGLALALVVAPAAAWAVFSTIYYGAPLPNTALAKLGGTLAARLDQGAAYIVASLVQDPGGASLVVMAAILAARSARRTDEDARIVRAGAVSAALALAYVLWCGGDFMLGRFLLPLHWAAIAVVLAGFPRSLPGEAPRAAAAAAALIGALLVVSGQSTTVLRLGIDPGFRLRDVAFAGAVDERRFWLPWFGAWSTSSLTQIPTVQTPRPTAEPVVTGVLGIVAYLAPRTQLVTDYFALTDPLVARIAPLPYGRPGHAYRPLPPEFWRWREDAHRFEDPRLDSLAQRLRLAHRSQDLWSAQRWHAIASLFFARYVPQDGLTVTEQGGEARLEVKPGLLYRKPTTSSQYLVWLRIYERSRRATDTGMTPGVDYTLALDASCAVSAVAPARNHATAIAVRAGETLAMRCPGTLLHGDGLLMRAGARETRDGAEWISYDETIVVARPALWWLDQVPRWIVQGWHEGRPRAALAAGLALLVLAAWLGWRTRR